MASNDPKPDTANNKPENASDDARADVTAAVEELLNSLSNKFAGVSSEIFAKSKPVCSPPSISKCPTLTLLLQVDEMSRRLDNLEAALQESNKPKDGSANKP
ncbi:unnamed protein product [Fusarium graminearum]|uniref:Chromosome 4, complete genome n=1 Tax=Gibberella zeae (strain ATCC MYA-4620 / CBS 123657 / FGSC 9075 / NRRL 31084 / PH-1) TaxID=229533 RepID=I1RSQ1_GIBZE|nr:hypothetical protein FGSG_07179 [Fusarium graminearum PH-1]ESU13394.1 hypothetical protein FGSG_07179 [Fusarium graminearum PH-1]EYB26578.1 hypothetical protein FG05_07179 [Fusarium graminearum]CEF82936.1 unnamed protein product [Fusarium graminearum]CZS72996.1 unnamed protein product [Fusarium graminearum]|eukprot:XP_011326901.1 hypothetical protein FGSG_07179 [Fusarium graminearum PH-1]